MLSCNLATQIAWLEGLSVLSECTGKDYCEVSHPTRSKNLGERKRYDPISNPAIWGLLIQKYRVDVDWHENGTADLTIYGGHPVTGEYSILAREFTGDHDCRFVTTLLTVILEAQKS